MSVYMGLIFKAGLALLALHLVYAVAIVAWRIHVGSAIADAAQPFERVVPDAAQRILLVGDSTGVGTGALDPTLSTAGQFGEAYPNAEIINRSRNGRKIHETLAVLDEFSGQHFSLVMIQIGGNDIIRFTPLPEVERDLVAMLEKARALSPNVVILHSGNVGAAPFFPRPWDLLWTARAREVRALYLRTVPEHGAHYVGLFQERRDDTWLKEPARYYAVDGLHPSALGYADWFSKIQATILANNIVI